MGAEAFRRLASRALEILVGVGRNAVSRKRGEFKLECLDSTEPPEGKFVTFVKSVAFRFDAESCEGHDLDHEGACGRGFADGGAAAAAGFEARLSGEGRSRGFPG